MKMKWISLLLALACVAAVFVGCGKDEPEKKTLAIEKYVNTDRIYDTWGNIPVDDYSKCTKIDALTGYASFDDCPDGQVIVSLPGEHTTWMLYDPINGKTTLSFTDTADCTYKMRCSYRTVVVEADHGLYTESTAYTLGGVELAHRLGDFTDLYCFFETYYVVDANVFVINAEGKSEKVSVKGSSTDFTRHDQLYQTKGFIVGADHPEPKDFLLTVYDSDLKRVGDFTYHYDHSICTPFIIGDTVGFQYLTFLPDDATDFSMIYDGTKARLTTGLLDLATMEITYADVDYLIEDLYSNDNFRATQGIKTDVFQEDAILADVNVFEEGGVYQYEASSARGYALNDDLTVKEDLTLFTGMVISSAIMTDDFWLFFSWSDSQYVYDRVTGECVTVLGQGSFRTVSGYYYVPNDGIYKIKSEGADGKPVYNQRVYDFSDCVTDSLINGWNQTWTGCSSLYFRTTKPGDGAMTTRYCMFYDGKVIDIGNADDPSFEVTDFLPYYSAFTTRKVNTDLTLTNALVFVSGTEAFHTSGEIHAVGYFEKTVAEENSVRVESGAYFTDGTDVYLVQ